MRVKKYIRLIATVLLLQVAYGCESQPAGATSPAVKPARDSSANTTKPAALTDEQLFRVFFSKFKNVIKTQNKTQIQSMFNFPLQTNPQWSNEDLKNSKVDYKSGLLTGVEFAAFYPDIFTKDAVKLIPASVEDDLSEIDKTTTEDYYKKLMPITDKGSTLYELEKQYTQDNGQETSFGFVFGKVKGSYKVISYYRPWPLKD
ncbi:hypothetical protein D0C36_12635 [Mucilaginibacter conchicola]|uniref:Uncharacterized protein n=1 Tax=Mucilaginibacter conchicola TaxID=2303333 RepID=A0A372NSL7_9SPHI|nr:hypothetical protein [Mucilaginibacter conchicola]RFZ92280.1 hypothetical protein D0C36_12635 [Mucilaginibacter conchicola]